MEKTAVEKRSNYSFFLSFFFEASLLEAPAVCGYTTKGWDDSKTASIAKKAFLNADIPKTASGRLLQSPGLTSPTVHRAVSCQPGEHPAECIQSQCCLPLVVNLRTSARRVDLGRPAEGADSCFKHDLCREAASPAALNIPSDGGSGRRARAGQERHALDRWRARLRDSQEDPPGDLFRGFGEGGDAEVPWRRGQMLSRAHRALSPPTPDVAVNRQVGYQEALVEAAAG